MPQPNSKSRQELRSRFVRNAIPTETDFADLIAASLNQADDGVLKLPDQPLGLVRQKPDQPVLRFFADPNAEGSVWQVQLGAGDKPGFGLAGADGKLALFVDGATGNVGIGTVNPGNKLTVQGNFNESKDPESGISNGGLLALKGNAPQIDFIDTEHGDWAIHVNDGRMYFIREPWEYEDLVLDGKGNIGIGSHLPEAKLNIREWIGTPASANKGTLLLDHEDDGGASSIVFRSKVNRGGGDHAFIEFRDKNPLINDGEAALLTIGMQNDINDHIALMPSGNVGIGTTTPGCKLDVNGDASIGGCLRIGAGCEIFFPKYGQIRSLDDAHRILFRIDDSKMELREYGDIVFSSGSTQGQETSKMVIHGSGNVGIGTTAPAAKLQVTGNVSITSAEGQNFACQANYMAPGSLTIGGVDRNYGGGSTKWNSNTAGLLLETLDNTEIAIHDSGLRLASFMYYEGANNCFTIGRDMGWGAISAVNIQGSLQVNGQTNSLTDTNPIRFTTTWTGIPDDKTNWAEICNDTITNKTLIIIGNKSNGGGRRVGIWDILEVNGSFQVNNNGNTFKIDTLADKAIFTLTKSHHGPKRQISWDGDNNWDQYSDETLKTNINIETGILPRLLQIDVKSFQWKDDLESKKRQLGFIAQDVRLAFPDLVKEKPFGDQSLMSLNYTNFGILAVGAIKELNAIMAAEIQELRVELDRLKQQVGD